MWFYTAKEVRIEAEGRSIVDPSDHLFTQAVEGMLALRTEDVRALRFCEDTRTRVLEGFCSRKLFPRIEVVECRMLKKLELTA